MDAPERLGEVGWLAITDRGRDLGHPRGRLLQELGRALSPHDRQSLPEGRTDLGEGTLNLSRRGRQMIRNVRHSHRPGRVALQELNRLSAQVLEEGCGGGSPCHRPTR